MPEALESNAAPLDLEDAARYVLHDPREIARVLQSLAEAGALISAHIMPGGLPCPTALLDVDADGNVLVDGNHLESVNQRIATAQGRSRQFFKVPDGLAAVFAALPLTPINSDQFRLLKRGSVPSANARGVKELGVAAKPLGLFLDRWMIRYRKHGRFGGKTDPAGSSPTAFRFPVQQGRTDDLR